ncbi:MAG: hypothetical protein AAGA65_00835 [Actinomycetota bacterium]
MRTTDDSRPGRSRRRLAALVTTLALAVSACGGSDTAGTTVGASGESAAPSPLNGEFTTFSGGQTFDLGSLEGQDVVLWFWAPW